MSERLPFEPPDPRLQPASPGELFRRQNRAQFLLAQVPTAGPERLAELAQELLVYGSDSLPAVRAAAHLPDPATAQMARAVLHALVPEEIGHMLASGLARDESGYPVEVGAAILARLDDPDLSVEPVIHRMDVLARKAGRFISKALNAPLNEKLLEERRLDVIYQLGEFWRATGFKGDVADYSDVRHTWLPQVLERRTGLPIVLSVIYLALCRRLGLGAEGVGLPWHFVVRLPVPLKAGEGYVLVDPYHGARSLDLDDCRKLVESSGQKFDPGEHLHPASPREVLARICHNLVAAYDQRKQTGEAERVTTVLVHLGPGNPVALLMRAERRLRRGAYRQARQDLEAVLALSPPPPLIQAAWALLRQTDYEHPFG